MTYGQIAGMAIALGIGKLIYSASRGSEIAKKLLLWLVLVPLALLGMAAGVMMVYGLFAEGIRR